MFELLPDQLGAPSFKHGYDSKQQGSKKKAISSILEWVQCFTIYISVIAQKQPQRVPDLLGNLNLIIEAHLEFSGDAWLGYDRHFQQRATSLPELEWARIDSTLWNLAFTDQANIIRCKHHHPHSSCDWTPSIAPSSAQPLFQSLPIFNSHCICIQWNNSLYPDCFFPDHTNMTPRTKIARKANNTHHLTSFAFSLKNCSKPVNQYTTFARMFACTYTYVCIACTYA